MNAVPYYNFLPHVLPHVPNCFEEQAVVAVRNACIDYCDATQIIQQEIDPITAVTGENTYEIDTPTGYRLAHVLSLYYKGGRIERKSELELQKLYTRDWQLLSGQPKVFTQFNQDEIVVALRPIETAKGAITGRICLVPTRDSTTVDGVLYERFLEDIVNGALARLKTTPDQPYTDVQAALLHGRAFEAASAGTRSFVNGGMNRAPMRVRYQRIW